MVATSRDQRCGYTRWSPLTSPGAVGCATTAADDSTAACPGCSSTLPCPTAAPRSPDAIRSLLAEVRSRHPDLELARAWLDHIAEHSIPGPALPTDHRTSGGSGVRFLCGVGAQRFLFCEALLPLSQVDFIRSCAPTSRDAGSP